MSIASRIQEIETHIEDVYDTINYSYDTTGINKNIINIPKYLKKGYIDIINNGIDTLYNNFPKVSGIGSNLSLTPTYEAPIKLNEIQGDTLQDGTPTPDTPVPIQSVTGLQNVNITGKNLFDINGTFTGNLIKYNNGFQLIKNSTNRTINYLPSSPIPKGTYTLSYEIVSSTLSDITKCVVQLFNSSNTQIATKQFSNDGYITFTTTDDITKLYFYINNNEETDTQITLDNIQLETGSSATEYEPYKGNTYEVNLGKNLFDKDNANILNAYINSNSNSSDYKKIISNNNSRTIYISCKSNTTYTVSKIAGQRFVVASCNNVPKVNVLCTNEVHDQTGVSLTITTGANDKYLVVFYYLSTADTSTEEQIRNSIQIEVGNQPTSYSPYFTPIELNKIGDYKDSIKKSTGKNLFDKDNTNSINAYINGNTMKFTSSGTVKTYYITCKPNTTYTIQKILSNQFRVGTSSDIPVIDGSILQFWQDNNATTHTILTDATAKYLCICIYNSSGATITEEEVLNSVMLNEGSTALPYEPYGKVWYVENNIGKVVLNGSEDYSIRNQGDGSTTITFNLLNFVIPNGSNKYCNYFSYNQSSQDGAEGYGISNNTIYFEIKRERLSSLDAISFKTWLSTHNTEVLYVLATPEYTEITNTELIEDLETLYTAKSQDGTTNISITSEDLEMILNVSALKGDA